MFCKPPFLLKHRHENRRRNAAKETALLHTRHLPNARRAFTGRPKSIRRETGNEERRIHTLIKKSLLEPYSPETNQRPTRDRLKFWSFLYSTSLSECLAIFMASVRPKPEREKLISLLVVTLSHGVPTWRCLLSASRQKVETEPVEQVRSTGWVMKVSSSNNQRAC